MSALGPFRLQRTRPMLSTASQPYTIPLAQFPSVSAQPASRQPSYTHSQPPSPRQVASTISYSAATVPRDTIALDALLHSFNLSEDSATLFQHAVAGGHELMLQHLLGLTLHLSEELKVVKDHLLVVENENSRLADLQVQSFRPTAEIKRSFRNLSRHFAVQPGFLHDKLADASERYVWKYPARFNLTLHVGNDIARQDVLRSLQRAGTEVRSSLRKKIISSLKKGIALDDFVQSLYRAYHQGNRTAQAPEATLAAFALMRSIARSPLPEPNQGAVQTKSRADTCFWSRFTSAIEDQVKTHGDDKTAPGWKAWYRRLILDDYAYNPNHQVGNAVESDIEDDNLNENEQEDDEDSHNDDTGHHRVYDDPNADFYEPTAQATTTTGNRHTVFSTSTQRSASNNLSMHSLERQLPLPSSSLSYGTPELSLRTLPPIITSTTPIPALTHHLAPSQLLRDVSTPPLSEQPAITRFPPSSLSRPGSSTIPLAHPYSPPPFEYNQ